METNEIISHLLHTPDNTNPKVLKDILTAASIASENRERIIQYAMKTPYNMNGNMLKFLLEPTPPVSNDTKFYMNFSSNESPLTLVFMQTIDEDTIIDWGDGTIEIAKNNVPEGQNTSTSNTHIYELAGEYTITLSNDSGSIILDSGIGSNYNIFYSSLYGTSTVKTANIGLNTSKIGIDAFYRCTSLQSVTIPNSVTEIGKNAFYWCESLQSVTIPNSVTEIGKSAFSSCTSLQSITIPNSVTEIGIEAFANCTSLPSITIPNSIIEIGKSAFANCTSLQSITIPASVTSIGEYAFVYCTAMQEYHFTSINPPSLASSNVFQDIPNDCIIYVPQESVNAYKTAQHWSDYASKIQGE